MHTDNRKPLTLLVALVAATTALRLVNLSYPASPVFDEAHFATYASNYAVGRPFFDIHPPLGKLLYALPLLGASPEARDIEFIRFGVQPGERFTTLSTNRTQYDAFPYVSLRLLSVLFGALLIVAVYAFLTALSGSQVVGLLGALFVALDSAFAVEARGIFLNSLFLALGFFALAAVAQNRPRHLAGGALLGLALAVKLIAIVFVPAFILLLYDPRREAEDRAQARRRAERGLAATFVVLTCFLVLPNSFIFSARERLDIYRGIPVATTTPSRAILLGREAMERVPALKHVALSAFEFELSIAGYTVGAPPHTYQSAWYRWPFAAGPMPYYLQRDREGEGVIALAGNPAVWGLALGLMLASVALMRRFRDDIEKGWPLFVLIVGYLSSLLPFALIARSTFMYHYFPALLFSIGIAALFLKDFFDRVDPRTARAVGLILVIALLAGFWLILPYTLGLASFA
ncbi:MAG: phospholipid carrier-dependent glycosyltransferase [bacterium]|nr:phospholipid carrier-dependent glycosyltransferase [bacterium]